MTTEARELPRHVSGAMERVYDDTLGSVVAQVYNGYSAEEIARRLNAHDALVAALERIAAEGSSAEEIEAHDEYDDTEGAEHYGLIVGLNQAAEIARAALAVARGEQ